MNKTSILLGALVAVAMAHAVVVVNANSVCVGANQPVHTYNVAGSLGANSNTLSEQTSGAPTGSVGGASAGFVTVQDTNTVDCNGDHVPGDFDGDLDAGVGGGFFGSSTEWDLADNCGYDLNVHSTSGVATDTVVLHVGGTWGVDDTGGPIVVPVKGDISDAVGALLPAPAGSTADDALDAAEGIVETQAPAVEDALDPITDGPDGAVCETDGSITPDTDAHDCLHVWVDTWSPGPDPVCAIGHGGDDGYWLFLQSGVSEDSGGAMSQAATIGTLAANS